MINPRILKPVVNKVKDPRFPGGKLYVPFLTRRTRTYFKRRTDAETYMAKIVARWCRLYDAAITAMVESEVPA